MTHGTGGWIVETLEVQPSAPTKSAGNPELNEPFSLCVEPSAFAGLIKQLKFSRELEMSYPMVRGAKRLCINADDLRLVDPKAKILDSSKAEELLIEPGEAIWTASVGVQHLINCLKPVAMAVGDPETNKALAKATLRFSPDLTFTAEATDGRILVRAEGMLSVFSVKTAHELVLSTATLNRLLTLLNGVPAVDTVTLSLTETELDGRDSGQMLALTFENTALDALIYLDRTLKSDDLNDLILSAKGQQSGPKAASNAEQLTELELTQSLRAKLRGLVEKCSQIVQLTTANGDLTAIAQTDVKDSSDEDDWFSSLPLQIGAGLQPRQIYLNGPTFLKVLSLFEKKVRLRLMGCDPSKNNRVKALVCSHADDALPHLDCLLIGLNLRPLDPVNAE